MSPARTTLAAGAVAAASSRCDQLAKALVRDDLALRRAARPDPRRLDLVHVRNSGIAFGFLSDGGAVLVVGTALALLALVVFFATHTGRALVWIPTGLLLGGAVAT